MNLKRISGVVLLLLGIFIAGSNFAVTGAVIGVNSSVSFIGIIFFIAGLFLLMSERGSEGGLAKLMVSEEIHSNGTRTFRITDPELYFSNVGLVTLEEFQRGYNEIKTDSDWDETFKEKYGQELLKIRKYGDKDQSRISEKFLRVVYGNKFPKLIEPVGSLDERDVDRIYGAFKGGWEGKPTNTQRKIMSAYGVGYSDVKDSQGHGHIYIIDEPAIREATSSSGSDVNVGRNVGHDVLRLAKRAREIKLARVS